MLHRVRIQNFKSLVDVDVELSPVTVLIGKSGTGKSNFFEALQFLRDTIAAGNPRQKLQQEWSSVLPATRDEAFPKFELEFSIPGISEKYNYTLHFSKHFGVLNVPQVPPWRETLKFGGECIFDQVASTEEPSKANWNVPPKLIPLPQPGSIAVGRLPSISEAVVAYTALTTGIGCYSFRADVLRNESKEDRQKGLIVEERQNGLNDSASNYISTMQEIGKNLQDLSVRKSMIGALRRVNSSVVSVELDDILKPKYAVVGHRFKDKTLSLNLSQQSDGFRRFLAHLFALFQKPPKQTLIFEHPEDGIHPGALAVLAEEFKAAPANGRGQVILTTHSPRLLDLFEVDQVRVVEMDGLETRIGWLADEQKVALREGLLDTGELLTVDPARIQASAMESTRG